MRAVNLIPKEERTDRGGGIPTGRSGGAIFVVFGLCAGLVVLALLYGLADHEISSRRTEVATLSARAQQEQARASQLAPYVNFMQLREQREQAVSTLVESRFDWAQAFHELARVLPPGRVSLSSIEGAIGAAATATTAAGAAAALKPAAATGASTAAGAAGAAAVTSATPPGSVPTFKLAGCATSQEEVALMLQRLRLVEGVKEVSLQSSTATGSGAGGGASGSSGCPGGAPVFAAQIVFTPLPTAPTSTAGSATAPATAGTGATGASATGGASATVASSPAPAGTTSTGAGR